MWYILPKIFILLQNFQDTSFNSFRACQANLQACQNDLQTQRLSLESQPSNGQAVEQLQQHCRDLETQLDNVKVQIIKILSEKRACSQENCLLKKRVSDLCNHLPDSSLEILAVPPSVQGSSTIDKSASPAETICAQPSNLKEDKAVSTSDDVTSPIIPNMLEEKIKHMEKLHANEMAALRDRCSDLEKSLSLMRDEYERCEDYWAGKLDEERQLAEQEQHITDEKFSELMTKIREYEEHFADDHVRRTSKAMDGRLETIEEQDGLEKQVSHLCNLITTSLFCVVVFPHTVLVTYYAVCTCTS